jgi:hypothetical protein
MQIGSQTPQIICEQRQLNSCRNMYEATIKYEANISDRTNTNKHVQDDFPTFVRVVVNGSIPQPKSPESSPCVTCIIDNISYFLII